MIDVKDLKLSVMGAHQMCDLKTLAGGQTTLVVLLRHRDCPFCEIHVGELVKAKDRVGRIVVTSFQDKDKLDEVSEWLPFDIVLGSDTSRSLYKALGAGRVTHIGFMLRPGRMKVMLSHLLRGRSMRRDHADFTQLGADMIIDRQGQIVWSHLPKHPADRPSVETIIEQMRDAA